MTALCGGASSSAKPNIGPILTLSATAIEAWISFGLGMPELAPVIAPIIGAYIDITINEYCATDPPPDPGLTAADIIAATAYPTSALSASAVSKILQWFEHRYWWEVCQCSGTVATPVPPTPSNPGQVTANPGLGSGVTVGPCWAYQNEVVWPANHFALTFQDLGSLYLPQLGPTATVTYPTVGGHTAVARSLPTGLSTTHLRLMPGAAELGGESYTVLLSYWDAGLNKTGEASVSWNSTTGCVVCDDTHDLSGPTVKYWSLVAYSTQGISGKATLSLQADCSTTAGTTLQVPCCPPDPLLEGYLQQILARVGSLSAPTSPSYGHGTVHTGLHDSGSLIVAGLVGVQVNVTAQPPGLVLPGTPPYVWDLGWMSILTVDGMIEERRLTRLQQVWLPGQMPLATTIGYYLNPGVTATITELIPA